MCGGLQEEKDDDEMQPESADRREHDADGQTGEENVQSESAVELGGEASEKDQAKEVKNHLRSQRQKNEPFGKMKMGRRTFYSLCVVENLKKKAEHYLVISFIKFCKKKI